VEPDSGATTTTTLTLAADRTCIAGQTRPPAASGSQRSKTARTTKTRTNRGYTVISITVVQTRTHAHNDGRRRRARIGRSVGLERRSREDHQRSPRANTTGLRSRTVPACPCPVRTSWAGAWTTAAPPTARVFAGIAASGSGGWTGAARKRRPMHRFVCVCVYLCRMFRTKVRGASWVRGRQRIYTMYNPIQGGPGPPISNFASEYFFFLPNPVIYVSKY